MVRKVFNLGFNPLFGGRGGTRTPDLMCVIYEVTWKLCQLCMNVSNSLFFMPTSSNVYNQFLGVSCK